MDKFVYKNERWGDQYTIWHERGVFLGAERHIGQVGSSPINYTALSELPNIDRQRIEEELCRLARKPKP